MAVNYFTLTYDTTGPASATLSINSGAQYTNTVLVTCAISTADSPTTGYQMKIFGDVDVTWGVANGVLKSGSVTATANDAQVIGFTASKQIQLATGDGAKNLHVIIYDDVMNPSTQADASITLDTAIPSVSITSGPDKTKISSVTNYNICSFSFQSPVAISQYVVKVVTSNGADHTTGVDIPTAGGSTGMSGSSQAANAIINCKIYAADLVSASAGEGAKIIKVFVADAGGNWSV